MADFLALIDKIFNDANRFKDEIDNKTLTITILDKALIKNVPRLTKLNDAAYQCYREVIVQTLKKIELSDKDKIKNILEITFVKCMKKDTSIH